MLTTTAENILNVTLLEPRQKHPTIFVRFDELAEGESLTIHNDHDPKGVIFLPGNTRSKGRNGG